MDSDLKNLKSLLREIVVKSQTEVDMRSLSNGHWRLKRKAIPIERYGYSDFYSFLKDLCHDTFELQGPRSNPVVTLVVPESLRNIDQIAPTQKSTDHKKKRGKRTSGPNTPRYYRESIPNKFPVNPNDNIKKINKDDNTRGAHGIPTRSDDMERLKKKVLIQLIRDICKLIKENNPEAGIPVNDLLKMYRERFMRELQLHWFGGTIVGLLAAARHYLCVTRDQEGNWSMKLVSPSVAEGASAQPTAEEAHAPASEEACALPTEEACAAPIEEEYTAPTAQLPPLECLSERTVIFDPDDALPGIDYAPDVFPEDCQQMEIIPTLPLAEFHTGTMHQVVVAQVYSPSHFWLRLLGPDHNLPMNRMMDEMSDYYRRAGVDRVLAGGAVRVGQYCSAEFWNDWHRAVIVKVLHWDTVKVRHVDFGTVETVQSRSLKPLLRRWAALPAQAVRARLAGLRPAAGAFRWPYPSARFLNEQVRDRRLFANIVQVDLKENALEVFLIDTAGADDKCVTESLIRTGHAERHSYATRALESYMYPRFAALENGDTLNYAEIFRCLADGDSLESVEEYRRHVPALPLAPFLPLNAMAQLQLDETDPEPDASRKDEGRKGVALPAPVSAADAANNGMGARRKEAV